MKRKNKLTKRKQSKRQAEWQRVQKKRSSESTVMKYELNGIEVETEVTPMDENFVMADVKMEAREGMTNQILDLVRQNLKSRRLAVASDYLDLVLMIHPQSVDAMLLRGELARAEGNQVLADVCKELSQCL